MKETFKTPLDAIQQFVETAEKFSGVTEGSAQHSVLLAIYNANKLIIKNSVLKNNQATDSGGAIGNDGYLSIKKSAILLTL